MPSHRTKPTARGRLPTAARPDREAAILDAALTELVESGPAGLSMAKVAARAGASKETLYAWFDNRDGLITALIDRSANATLVGVNAALATTDAPPEDVLTDFAVKLLSLLVSPSSIALNRAAMTSPQLASQLLESGRFSVGPIVENYLARLNATGQLATSDPAAAFELLYGLIVRDTQIRVLLGDRTPSRSALVRRAAEAVETFLQLHGSPSSRRESRARSARRGEGTPA